MRRDFDLDQGYCREILAYLALHPGGVELDQVHQHTARRVRAKKSFEGKFRKSLHAILQDAPFAMRKEGGVDLIAPHALADGFAADHADFEQVVLGCIPADRDVKLGDVTACVRTQVDPADVTSSTFEAHVRSSLRRLSDPADGQVRRGEADGVSTYRRNA